MYSEKTVSGIIEKLQDKKIETGRFVKKYQERKMVGLEEYYKGANWALDWAIKTNREKTIN